MKLYQIVEIAGKFNHAGSKATSDVAEIAEKIGFIPLRLHMNTTAGTMLAKLERQFGYWQDWRNITEMIEDDSLVLLQHPFHYPQLTREASLKYLKEKKHVKFISVIHDVEKLRAFRYNDYYKQEFEFMRRIADVYIVHNEVMKSYFVNLGISADNIIVLDIFDYLLDDTYKKFPVFSKSLSIAGNLDITKCAYISELPCLSQLQIDLYGSNYDKKLNAYSNIHYHGSFPPDDIPAQLNHGFGLVWDGSSIDGCKGESGHYLKYNNPHKLSLFLASGLPIVIWKDAAEASFVESRNLGICVNDLMEAEKMIVSFSQEEYMKKAVSVKKISSELTKGVFMQHAINEALNRFVIE